MTDSRNRLEQLVNLAGEDSSERRRELLREITDVFMIEPSEYTERETRYFGEIMSKVAYDLEREMRVELANRLASEAAAPPDLIRQLANDEISVAQPVISKSPVLEETDLIEIAKTKSQDHLMAITRREDIGETLSDVLVDKGDDRVLHGLVTNKLARINDLTMNKVVRRAEDAELLHEPLINRPDLPADMLKDMLSFVSSELQDRVLAQGGHVNADKLRDVLADIGSDIETRNQGQKDVRSKPEFLIDQLVRKGELTEATLCQFAREQKQAELMCGMSTLTDVDMATIRRILLDRSGEGLAILCKASGFERTTFTTIINNVWPEEARSIEQSCKMSALYDKVTAETAQRVLRFWKVRKQSEGDTPAADASAA